MKNVLCAWMEGWRDGRTVCAVRSAVLLLLIVVCELLQLYCSLELGRGAFSTPPFKLHSTSLRRFASLPLTAPLSASQLSSAALPHSHHTYSSSHLSSHLSCYTQCAITHLSATVIDHSCVARSSSHFRCSQLSFAALCLSRGTLRCRRLQIVSLPLSDALHRCSTLHRLLLRSVRAVLHRRTTVPSRLTGTHSVHRGRVGCQPLHRCRLVSHRSVVPLRLGRPESLSLVSTCPASSMLWLPLTVG